jgi:hypothetical protein
MQAKGCSAWTAFHVKQQFPCITWQTSPILRVPILRVPILRVPILRVSSLRASGPPADAGQPRRRPRT